MVDDSFIEGIAREFDIPLEEAKKRMKEFIGEIPIISDETRRKKQEAMDSLKFKRKRSKRLNGR